MYIEQQSVDLIVRMMSETDMWTVSIAIAWMSAILPIITKVFLTKIMT